MYAATHGCADWCVPVIKNDLEPGFELVLRPYSTVFGIIARKAIVLVSYAGDEVRVLCVGFFP